MDVEISVKLFSGEFVVDVASSRPLASTSLSGLFVPMVGCTKSGK